MASMDDANHDESGEGKPSHDRGDSGFGPPVSEFGPPVDAFGPPTGDVAPVGWQPADEPIRPAVGWQPADEPEPSGPAVGWQPTEEASRPAVGWQPADDPSRPAVGWQAADVPAAPTVPAPPQQYRAPDSTGSRETVRAPGVDPRRGPAPETVRYSDQGGAQQGSDQGTWWQQGTAQTQGPSQRPPTGPPRQVAGQTTGPRETPRSLWDDDDLAKKLQAPREPAQAAKGSSSNSLWDDDDLVENFGSPRETAPAGERGWRSRGVLIGGVAAAVVVIAAIAAVVVFVMHGKSANPNPGPTPATLAIPPSPDALNCHSFSNGTITIGNGPGDTASAAGAILGFEHGFYTDRSAEKAKSFVAPGALDVNQQVIDGYPKGTSYCLRITAMAPETYNVEINENRTDGKKSPVYTDVFTVPNTNGKYLISGLISK